MIISKEHKDALVKENKNRMEEVKQKNQICECGDKYRSHHKATGKCYKCSCTEFKARLVK